MLWSAKLWKKGRGERIKVQGSCVGGGESTLTYRKIARMLFGVFQLGWAV